MAATQISIQLAPKKRGFHLITNEIIAQIGALPTCGIITLFIQHTSCALSLNENADPTVRVDFESTINKLIPENQSQFRHTLEGSDDMPAHIKSSLFGASVTIPITNGRLNLGTWQGIYLCEFRNYGGSRSVVATILY